MVKTVGKYELYRTLGEGSFGKVKYAVNKETNEAVAIKILDKEKIQKQNMGAQIKKEISIMKMINHKNVVAVKDVFATTSKIFIVLELVEGGELFDKISSQGRLNEEQARFYFRQLVEGMEHCHSQGVCHRDLKPENLLLDTQGNIKISDFGLSALYVGDAEAEGDARAQLLHTTCGTPNYVAPEVLANHGYDGKRADVWSMGVILYVLLAGFLPFEENTMVALFLKIKNADFTYPSWFTPGVRQLLDAVLVSDPSRRLTLKDVKEHPWVAEGPASPGPPTPAASEKIQSSVREYVAAHAHDHDEDTSSVGTASVKSSTPPPSVTPPGRYNGAATDVSAAAAALAAVSISDQSPPMPPSSPPKAAAAVSAASSPQRAVHATPPPPPPQAAGSPAAVGSRGPPPAPSPGGGHRSPTIGSSPHAAAHAAVAASPSSSSPSPSPSASSADKNNNGAGSKEGSSRTVGTNGGILGFFSSLCGPSAGSSGSSPGAGGSKKR